MVIAGLRPPSLGAPAVLLAVAWLALAACSREPQRAVRWQRLASGFVPELELSERTPWGHAQGGRETWLAPGPREHHPRVETRVPREGWTRRGARLWSTPRVLATEAVEDEALLPELRGPQGNYVYLPTDRVGGHFVGLAVQGLVGEEVERAITRRIDEPSFVLAVGLVYLILPEGDEPPREVLLQESLSLGRTDGDAWKFAGPAVVADGIPVLPGFSQEFTLAHDSAARSLQFDTVVVGGAAALESLNVTFRVVSDGEVLLRQVQKVAARSQPERHVLSLAGVSTGSLDLRFEVEGPPCVAAFLTPTLGPESLGTPASRPWDSRPDVVFVLADTFRADNLAAWGGDPELTPNLNQLAAQSQCFLAAYTPASWTLPAHASFFAGAYPRQLGATTKRGRLSDEVFTVAEHFAAHGYRTVAVTEGGYVSRHYGLAQGFEWFEEHHAPEGIHRSGAERMSAFEHTIRRTLERSAVDDGRPLFLFVQTYRAHDPYFVSEPTRRRLTQLSFDGECDALYEEMISLGGRVPRGRPYEGRRRELAEQLRTLYRGASADLDAGLGELFTGLHHQQRLTGVTLVTSDHGEAFGEHGTVGHAGGTWWEESRVPLLLRAPDLGAGTRSQPVSLLSLPRTLSALADLDPHMSWTGRNLLLDPEPGRPVLTYQLGHRRQSDVAVLSGGEKLIFEDQGLGTRTVRHAYRVSEDPWEQRDLANANWVAPLRARWAPRLEDLEVPVSEPGSATISAQQKAALRALGYAGDK